MDKIIKEKFKVGVIEDDAVMSKSISEELTDAGFAVVNAFDGEEGFNMVLREKPDVILLDILMPKVDGIAMMKKLRESGEFGKGVPIIILTNLSGDDKIGVSVVQNEPAYYIVKSATTVSDIVEKVKDCLRSKPNAAS